MPFSLISYCNFLFFSSASLFFLLLSSACFYYYDLLSAKCCALLINSYALPSFFLILSILFCSISLYISCFFSSSLSFSCAKDISSNKPYPIISVGSNPLFLLTGYLSNSRIYLIISSLLAF